MNIINSATEPFHHNYYNCGKGAKAFHYFSLLLGLSILASGLTFMALSLKKINLDRVSFLGKPACWGSLLGVGGVGTALVSVMILAAKIHNLTNPIVLRQPRKQMLADVKYTPIPGDMLNITTIAKGNIETDESIGYYTSADGIKTVTTKFSRISAGIGANAPLNHNGKLPEENQKYCLDFAHLSNDKAHLFDGTGHGDRESVHKATEKTFKEDVKKPDDLRASGTIELNTKTKQVTITLRGDVAVCVLRHGGEHEFCRNKNPMQAQLIHVPVTQGDKILLMTDGMDDFLSDGEIVACMEEGGNLIATANRFIYSRYQNNQSGNGQKKTTIDEKEVTILDLNDKNAGCDDMGYVMMEIL